MIKEVAMVTAERLVLYGNSIFLAGIKAVLKNQEGLELVSMESDINDPVTRISSINPRAVFFDLAEAQPDFAISLMREKPGILLIGVHPCQDEMLVFSGQPARALNINDLMDVIR